MRSHNALFWTERDEYHELAEQFERNIEVGHPDGPYECDLNGFTSHCPYCISNAKRYEYRGPKI